MEYKTQRNKRTGEVREVVKIDGEWLPTSDPETQKRIIAEQEGVGSAMLIGAGKKTRDLAAGIEGLGVDIPRFTDTGTEGYDALKQAHPVATEVGEFGSELAQIALPGAAAAKGLKGVGALANSPIGRATLADVAAASGMAAARDPGENTRGENAASEALLGLLGGAVTKGLGGLFTPNAVAREALDRGEYLTPAYATDSNFLNAIESAGEVTPGFAAATKQFRGEAQRDWRNNVLNKVGEKLGIKVSGDTGAASFRQIDDVISAGYKESLDQVKNIPDEAFTPLFTTSSKVSANLNPSDQLNLKSTLKRLRILRKQLARGRKGQEPNQVADSIDALLRDKASVSEGPLRTHYVNMRKKFHSGLEPNISKRLAKLDEVYPDMLVLNDAVGAANKEMMEGGFSPKQLMTGSNKKAAGRSFAREESPLYDAALAGGKTVGKKEGGAPLEWFRRLAGGVPSPPGMKAVGNALIGEASGQKAVKELPEFLLRNVSPSRILPGASNEEDEDNIYNQIKSLLGI